MVKKSQSGYEKSGHKKPRSDHPRRLPWQEPERIDLRQVAAEINDLLQNTHHIPQQMRPDGELVFKPGQGQVTVAKASGTSLTIEIVDVKNVPVDYPAASRSYDVAAIDDDGKPVTEKKRIIEDPSPVRFVKAVVTVHYRDNPVQGIKFTGEIDGRAFTKQTNCDGKFVIDNLRYDQIVHLHCPIPKHKHRVPPGIAFAPSGSGHNGNGHGR